MKIIILGAGQVGGTLATHLAGESSNEVTVVDNDEVKLKALREHLDVGTVVGHAAYPDVLGEAGAEDADVLIAVTHSDETNMLACQIAYTMYQTPTKIARIRSDAFSSREELFQNAAIPIDVLISPERLLTSSIEQLIQYPGTLQVSDFSNGRIQCVTVIADQGGCLVGQSYSQLQDKLPNIEFRIAAIYREREPLDLDQNPTIALQDEVFFMAPREDIKKLISALREEDRPNRVVMIAGGGNVGAGAAKILEENYQVKIIENDKNRAAFLAEQLSSALVLVGDSTDKQLLRDEYIEHVDVFCAVTANDETNIMSSVLAKRLGVSKVMTLINRLAYVDLVEGGEIDVVISPQQITVGYLLKHIRLGDVVKVHSLRHEAEAIEAIAHGDQHTSKVVGREIKDLELPEGVRVMAVVRYREVMMATPELMIENEDHVILFLLNRHKMHEVEKLFQVKVTFL